MKKMGLFHWHWVVLLVIGIILLLVFIWGYNVQGQGADLPFWLWCTFFAGIIFILLAFATHATEVVAAGPIPNTPSGGAWYHRDDNWKDGQGVEDLAHPYPVYLGNQGKDGVYVGHPQGVVPVSNGICDMPPPDLGMGCGLSPAPSCSC